MDAFESPKGTDIHVRVCDGPIPNLVQVAPGGLHGPEGPELGDRSHNVPR
jgi:hypothetical protein